MSKKLASKGGNGLGADEKLTAEIAKNAIVFVSRRRMELRSACSPQAFGSSRFVRETNLLELIDICDLPYVAFDAQERLKKSGYNVEVDLREVEDLDIACIGEMAAIFEQATAIYR